MTMKRIFSIIATTLLVCNVGFAKEPKQQESYNYQRGIELISSDNLDEGIDFLKKELYQNPKNGYAEAWMASAYSQKNERGTALIYADEALKHLPKSDKYYIAWTHNLKGDIYLNMGDTAQALLCLSAGIKTEPQK